MSYGLGFAVFYDPSQSVQDRSCKSLACGVTFRFSTQMKEATSRFEFCLTRFWGLPYSSLGNSFLSIASDVYWDCKTAVERIMCSRRWKD
eukprot:3892097-Amphidinium_carterae.1